MIVLFLVVLFFVYLFIENRLNLIENLDKYIILSNKKTCLLFKNKYGVLRKNLIKNIAQSPWNVIFGEKIYPKHIDKINYLLREIISQHLFVDGNKRSALIILELMSDLYCLKLKLSEEQKYQLIMDSAKGINNNLSRKDFSFRFRIIPRSIDQIIIDNKEILEKLGRFEPVSGLTLL